MANLHCIVTSVLCYHDVLLNPLLQLHTTRNAPHAHHILNVQKARHPFYETPYLNFVHYIAVSLALTVFNGWVKGAVRYENQFFELRSNPSIQTCIANYLTIVDSFCRFKLLVSSSPSYMFSTFKLYLMILPSCK